MTGVQTCALPIYDKKELERFRRFKTYLEESFCQLDHIGKEMPTQWVAVRKGLVKYERDNWISVEQFNKVCHAKGITEAGDQEDLLDIFHTLGYVLHYKAAALRGMVILNREWVTDALYRVLDDAIVRENKGWFRRTDAEKIWHEAKYKNRAEELLSLMGEFKLSYFNAASQKHIVPAKLPDDTEGLPDWDKTQNVRLHLQYDWMPRAVPTQLIVSLHDYIVLLENKEHWIWRRGAVLDGEKLTLPKVQVKIEDNWRENRIEISAHGTHSDLLMRTIMKHWREVNQPFADKVEVTKIILCSCERCQTAARPFEFEYDDVLEAKEAREPLKCNKSRKEFLAADILRGVFDETTALVDAFTRKGGRMSDELKELLANDNIEAALDKLPKDDFIIQSQARLTRLNRKEGEGILANDEINLERNKIVNSLLSYLSDENRRFSGKALK